MNGVFALRQVCKATTELSYFTCVKYASSQAITMSFQFSSPKRAELTAKRPLTQ